MTQVATHDGKVIAAADGKVKVEMHVLSACSSCKAHGKCGFADGDDKIVEVETPDWQRFSEGDSVTVSVNEGLGLLAVLLAYILPAVVILAAVIVLSLLTSSELLAALVPIILIALYFLVLYNFKDRLQKKFGFGITKS